MVMEMLYRGLLRVYQWCIHGYGLSAPETLEVSFTSIKNNIYTGCYANTDVP